MVVIYGIHAVSEALKSGGRSFDYVGIVRERHDQRVQRIIDDCRASDVQVRFLTREELDRTANTNTHQGVIAVTTRKQYADVDALLEQRHGGHSFLVVLDGVEDPHNLGALIRSADGAGADGVIIPDRRAAGLTGTAVKASAGASEHLPIARVTNISRTLDELKERNVWTVGLDERGTQSLRRNRLQDALRYRARRRRQGPARSGAPSLRLPGLHPHARTCAVTQCFRGGRCGDVRSCATASAAGAKESQAVEMKRLVLPYLWLACSRHIRRAIDRSAFTITRYQLEVQVDRTSHVMAVTGKLTLRNDAEDAAKSRGAAGLLLAALEQHHPGRQAAAVAQRRLHHRHRPYGRGYRRRS